MGRLARINSRRHVIDTLEAVDGFAALRNGIGRLARERGDWAGIPMPLEGLPLVVEPKFPKAEELASIGRENEKEEPLPDGVRERNCFWSLIRKSHIVIWEEPDGRILWGPYEGANRVDMAVMTMHAADAWGIEQESRAVQLLGTLVRHHQLKKYLLTGMFMETSQRSGVTYIFRRLRPTIALRHGEGIKTRVLAALCLHPIAYYRGTWAGGMCPTDDVVAALMLMRGDEHLYWRRANQHAPWAPEAGL